MVVSEVSHVFCCIVPTLFTVITFLVGMGLIGAMPMWMDGLHGAMHSYEIPLIITSGFILSLGWGLHLFTEKLDCHDTSCAHGSCKPKKKKALTILKFATILFLANISIFTIFHGGASLSESILVESDAASVYDRSHEHNHHH